MWLIVHNPTAGTHHTQWRARRAIRLLQERAPSVRVEVPGSTSATMQMVRQAIETGVERVIACGGDGTAGAVAQALVGSTVPLGILPAGTTNVLALECGMPFGVVRAARRLLGPVRERHFRTWTTPYGTLILALGVGLDARLMRRTPPRLKRALGLGAVGVASLREFATYDFPQLTVEVEDPTGVVRVHEATYVMVCNTKRYAGPIQAVPTADPEDDELDVILFQSTSRPRLVWFWARQSLPGSGHLQLAGVRHVRVRRFRIESRAGYEVDVHLNGDPCGVTPVDAVPGGTVRILAPL
jgi:diacylglycerol kinase (ATP)